MNRRAAHFFLEGLQEIGVEYLFCNLGTDHVPLIEELARWRQQGRNAPTPILCPHENVAVHMACGYAMATGRGQAVLVHVDAGTANTAMGLHNLFRSRVPVLLFAGKAPFTLRGELLGSRDTFVNFLQEPYDMASLVRPYVKWTYDLPSGLVVKEALRRAHSVMHSDPPGPVFLTAAREVLAAECGEEQVRSFPAERYGPVAAIGIDDAAVEDIAQRLLAARNPVLITAYAGRNPVCPPIIDELAQLTGMRVYESNPIYLNIAHDSPCFAGFSAAPDIGEADFGLLVDVDVPWIPKFASEHAETGWVHIDIDVIKKDFPMWGFPSHLRIQADSCKVLRRVLERVREKASADYRRAARARVALWTQRRAGEAERALHAAQLVSPSGMSAAFVAARLSEVMGEDDILVHEAITNMVPVLEQIRRNRPGTVFGNGGGGLGFGGGVALGAKLACPGRTVFHVTGDASFCFSAPTPVYMVSKQYQLPIFTVVLDNSGWGAVKGATLRVYPEGAAKSAHAYQAAVGTDIHYEKVGQAAGAYGERVEDPAALPAAIRRGMEALSSGRSVVLVVRLEPI
ncbi:MAG: thiamine pyrophosphate-requiring protein [Telluria sp.]|nr:thiamine pyrophosphate-requiring protein [Telluria sp.]